MAPSVAGSDAPPQRRYRWLWATALVIAVFASYYPAWNGGFIWDDDLHLINNPVLKPGGVARAWFKRDYINYWPLTFSLYRLEFDAWGLQPLGFHLVNIALHAATALLVWQILVKLAVPGAMVAAAIFALHPVNVESVAWIAQLKGILALFFGAISTLLYLQDDRLVRPLTPRRSSDPTIFGRRYVGAIIAFALSALAKGMLLTLPAVLLACVWWRRRRVDWRDWVRILPYILIGLVMAYVEISKQRSGGSGEVRDDSWGARIAVAGCAIWFYLGKLIWPAELCVNYPRWNIHDDNLLWYLPGFLLAVLFVWAWWHRRTWGRPVVMLLFCYVMLLLPALGFVNIYYMRYSLVADHYQYAATIVPSAMLTGVVAAWLVRHSAPHWAGPALGLVVLAVLTGLTWLQTPTYASMEALYRETIERNPNSWLAYTNLGKELYEQKRVDEAIEQFKKAIKLKPDSYEAHKSLGKAFLASGKAKEAIAQFEKVVELKPNDAEARRDLAVAHNTLGIDLASHGQYEAAVEQYQKALAVQPSFAEAHRNLGLSLFDLHKVDDAIAEYSAALEFKPDYPEAEVNLGKAFEGRDWRAALTHYRRAVELNPDYPEGNNNLGAALLACITQGFFQPEDVRARLDEAVRHFQKAIEISPADALAHFNLGIALAHEQKREQALDHFQTALALFTAQKNARLANIAQQKIDEVRQKNRQ